MINYFLMLFTKKNIDKE